MKIRYALLAAALVLSSLGVAGYGAYLKYEVIRPLGLPEYGDKSIMELPFLSLGDDVLKFMLENADELLETQPPKPSVNINQSTAATTVPSVPPTTVTTTVPSTIPSTTETIPSDTMTPTTQPPATQAPTTQKPTTQPTQPSTAPGNEPSFQFPGAPVDSSWFDNVLFIGNSRTCGLRGHYRNGKSEYFCDYGMTVYNFDEKRCSDKNFKDLTLEELLASKQYDKIIINFGLNESGYPLYSFKLAYEKMYQTVRAAQPDAKIILQSILGVTRYKYAEGAYYHPDNLAKMNQVMQDLADGVNSFYIDGNPWFTDGEGFLYESLTNDGYHLDPEALKEYGRWIAHAVNDLGI